MSRLPPSHSHRREGSISATSQVNLVERKSRCRRSKPCPRPNLTRFFGRARTMSSGKSCHGLRGRRRVRKEDGRAARASTLGTPTNPPLPSPTSRCNNVLGSLGFLTNINGIGVNHQRSELGWHVLKVREVEVCSVIGDVEVCQARRKMAEID